MNLIRKICQLEHDYWWCFSVYQKIRWNKFQARTSLFSANQRNEDQRWAEWHQAKIQGLSYGIVQDEKAKIHWHYLKCRTGNILFCWSYNLEWGLFWKWEYRFEKALL